MTAKTNKTTKRPSRKVKVTFIKSEQTEREKLLAVYRSALMNFAVSNADIAEDTGFDAHEVNRLASKLARTGLLEGVHVNSERTITWQTWYDVLNEPDGEEFGMQAFAKVYPPEVEVTKDPAPKVKRPGSGPRYEADQMEKAIELRKSGLSWKAVAAEVGVKSPFHFSKVVRSNYKDVK